MMMLCNSCGKDISVSGKRCPKLYCPIPDEPEKRTTKWCGACKCQVDEEFIPHCRDSRCHLNPKGKDVEARIKEYKCQKCGITCNPEALDLTANTCSMTGCSMKQLQEFRDRISEKKQGMPKRMPAVPRLLQNNVGNPEPSTGVSSSTNDEKFFEVDVPDPIVIFVHRDGKVEYRQPLK